MDLSVLGLHHVTAVTADIIGNLEFYTGPLGMRLVKKSVNQDDVRAYHLFYADAAGTPGTDMTFFDWPTTGSNRPGPGAVSLTTMRVPSGALDFWQARLEGSVRGADGQGRDRLTFADPEGQALALIDDMGLPTDAEAWDRVVPADKAIRGLYSVDIPSARPDSTIRVLVDLLGSDRSARGSSKPDRRRRWVRFGSSRPPDGRRAKWGPVVSITSRFGCATTRSF